MSRAASKKKPATKQKRANKSELHRKTGLDRATITKRLEAAGVKPKVSKPKEEIYDADQALKVLSAGDRSGITSARLKRLNVASARELLKLKKERGELVSRPDALAEQTRIFTWLFKELSLRRRRAITNAVRKARTQKDAELIYAQAVTEVFNELRTNYRSRGLEED